MNIKPAVPAVFLAMLVACSEHKEEPALTSSAAPETVVTQLEQDAGGQSDVVEMEPELGFENEILDTETSGTDSIEPDVLDSDESNPFDDRIASKEPAILSVADDIVASSSVEETKVNTIYTIKAGDTLGAISKSHNVTVASIVDNNNLPDRNTIRVGQQLVIK